MLKSPVGLFSELESRHLGLDITILGSSWSLNNTTRHTDGAIFIGDSFLRTDQRAKTKFIVRANNVIPNLTKESHIEKINELGAINIFASSIPESTKTVKNLMAETLAGPNFVFDQRHFGGNPCRTPQNCCESLREEFDGTIQEHLAQLGGLDHHYSSGDTVAIHALATAIFMGAKQIFMAGIDLPTLNRDYRYSPQVIGYPELKLSTHAELNGLRLAAVGRNSELVAVLKGSLKAASARVFPARSVFANDMLRIFSDFQYLIDIARSRHQDIFFCSRSSNLSNLNGIRSCPVCIAAS